MKAEIKDKEDVKAFINLFLNKVGDSIITQVSKNYQDRIAKASEGFVEYEFDKDINYHSVRFTYDEIIIYILKRKERFNDWFDTEKLL